MAAFSENNSLVGGETVAHPVGIALLVVCAITILSQKRERVIYPLVLFMVLIPGAQRIVIASIDFSFIRILVMVLLARILIKKEGGNFKLQKPDVILFWWMGMGILAYGLLLGPSGIITRTGYMLDTVGAYCVGRVYLRSSEDIKRVLLMVGLFSLPVLVFFLIERASGKNMFYVFGGIPEYTMVRNSRLRCQGPFAHPIMAGVFWATLLPWFIGMYYGKSASKTLIFIYISSIFIIVINTASSTPVMVILFTFLGISMFKIRHKMGLIRKLLFGLIVSLHLVMKAPVWHLISRIDLSGGSTGWHRFNLIEQSINHFGEWWFVGIASTRHWSFGAQDMTNQYLLEGMRGGIIGFILYIWFIVRVYSLLGQAQRKADSKSELWFQWSSGVMLFTHTMSFLAAAYFGQANIAFFLFIGGSISASASVIQKYKLKMSLEREAS
jgi:hypothetical protein